MPVTLLAIAVAASAAAVIAWSALVRTVVVYDGHRAVLYRRGLLVRVLDPGLHRIARLHARVQIVDVRAQYLTVQGQEVLTADGVVVRASVAAVFEVADVATALTAASDWAASAYLTVQLALREAVAGRPVEEVLAGRGEIGAQLVELAGPPLATLGIALRSADVKDLTLPGELRRLFAQVVEARQEGLAALERARGETAALRNLANAAKAVGDNPALLQLRMLQAIEASAGNTFVIGSPPS